MNCFFEIWWLHLSDINDAGSKEKAETENGDHPTHPNRSTCDHQNYDNANVDDTDEADQPTQIGAPVIMTSYDEEANMDTS